jgi:GNAT superfamily N-acetyltransferase
MAQVLSFPADRFPATLNWQAVSFMRVEWPFIDFCPPYQTYPSTLRPMHFALVEDDLLLSYAATFRLSLEHHGASYQMQFLGNVFTFPGARRQGHGGQIVSVATEHILRSGADAGALLCGPDLIQFYARFGWQPASADTLVHGDAAEGPTKQDAVRMMLFGVDAGSAARDSLMNSPLQVPFAW